MSTDFPQKNPHAFLWKIQGKHVDNVDNLFANQVFAYICHVSGSHSYTQIAGDTFFQ